MIVLAFVAAKGKLRRSERPRPWLRRGWALIRVRFAGICNTDIEILRGYHAFRGVLGHEFVGEVADVHGVSATQRRKWMGRRVCGEINVSCAAYGDRSICEFCKRGWKSHCARRTVLGIVAHDGAFAEFLTLPLENLHLVPDSVSDERAVFVEPLAAACEILEQVELSNFRNVAVLGDGKLAQLIARVLRNAFTRVVMYGKHENKLALARQAGVAARLVPGDQLGLKRLEDSFSLVIEATGSRAGLKLAQLMTEPRGTMVLKSTFHGPASETWPIVVKELTVIGSRCGPFERAISLLESGKLDPDPLITRTIPLAEAPRAMRLAQRAGVMKVLVKN
ncbi:MAG TPA: alcohol dehydrogenase catalytic domain-containing protein [Candidatus Acidoferrum sp.]|nr:alcohol dehydrogenase catalytic domain-containing protein [Candidatus Acidoferrum sp.]